MYLTPASLDFLSYQFIKLPCTILILKRTCAGDEDDSQPGFLYFQRKKNAQDKINRENNHRFHDRWIAERIPSIAVIPFDS